MWRKSVAALCVSGLMAACTSSSKPTAVASSSPTTLIPPTSIPSPTPTGYNPVIDPASFVSTVDNPYFPLKPGTTLTYEGVRDGKGQRDVFAITGETKVIMGVTSLVVRDTATRIADGKLIEKTDDWFAQDKEGNVWYMGEDTKTYDASGNVDSTEGSWEGGVDGALPGIVMPADPQAPSAYRQEYYKGQAEDQAWIVSLTQSVTVPYLTSKNAIETLEWSELEPDVIETKYYVSGIGLVLAVSVAGEVEDAKLVSVTTGP
jgi:hypothetical protein